MYRPLLRRCLATVLSVTALTAAVGVATPASAAPPPRLADHLVRHVSVNNINRHLVAFQRIAHQNDGNRAAGTSGYDASAEYVYNLLQRAGYHVSYQEFPFVYEEVLENELHQTAPVARTFNPIPMTYSGSAPEGGLHAPLSVLPVDATPGCEAEDFQDGSYAGTVVMIFRGSCTFAQKAINAEAAGAVGVLIYNNDADLNAPLNGTLGEPNLVSIPVAGLTRGEGETLAADAQSDSVTVHFGLRILQEERTTRNVIAQTRTGRTDNVVMLGAHLDGVQDGPGINDNGSGSAALLEIALQLANQRPRNAVRFAFWGAEENGLLGSEYYVSQLSFEEQLDIALYLNFDMIGSPNYVRFIYDGDDSDGVGAGPGPYGSAQIEDVFEDYFDRRSLAYEGTDFTGRSDYGPFIEVGIPSGGLFTGAEERKTAEQAAIYGGTAGEAFDPCYHQACDNLGNVNRTVLDQMADAAAWATGVFATDTSAVNGSTWAQQQRERAARAALSARASVSDPHHPVI